MKVLILGHRGMLGRTLLQYLELQDMDVVYIEGRWPSEDFKQSLVSVRADFIVNCIGAIPQKKPTEQDYVSLNIELPRFLETLNVKIIHPSTDCEFNGQISLGDVYTKESVRDAIDSYSKSKADISLEIETQYKNTKIIRTSIIGHELHTQVALLDWFLSQISEAKGFTNHYWNGITTLQWAKQAKNIIDNWEAYPVLNQYATIPDTKYGLLQKIVFVYKKDINVIPFEAGVTINKCLSSDIILPTIEVQLQELKDFFDK